MSSVSLIDIRVWIYANPWLATAYGAAFFMLFEYWKVIPLAYHVRVLVTMVQGMFASPIEDLEECVETDHVVRLGDRDWNGHQNNSCYSLEIDVVRYLWVMRFMKHSPSWQAWYRNIMIANGGVSLFFLKEMKYRQPYKVRTRLTHADRKWFYLQSDFVHPQTGMVFATGLSRIVFKERSGRTLPPSDVLTQLGYTVSKARIGPGATHKQRDFVLEEDLQDVLPSPGSGWPGVGMAVLLGSLQSRVAGTLPLPGGATDKRKEPDAKSKAH